MYADDYNGWTPTHHDGAKEWNYRIYTGGYAPNPGYHSGKRSIFVCPSYPTHSGYNGVWYAGGSTYGWNRGYAAWDNVSQCHYRITTTPVQISEPGSTTTDGPSNFLLIADSCHSSEQVYGFCANTMGGWYIHCRHSRMANCLFADGHVKALSKSQIVGKYAIVGLYAHDGFPDSQVVEE